MEVVIELHQVYSPAGGIPCTEEGMLLVDTFGKTTRLAFKEKDGVGPLARATTLHRVLQDLLHVRSPLNDSVRLDLPYVFR